MQLEIKLGVNINSQLYTAYSKFIYSKMKRTVSKLVNKYFKKYTVREKAILNCSLIKWRRIPKSINLTYYVKNCLQLVKIEGVYVIRINPYQRVRGSYCSVNKLIRILEYGTDKIPEFPLLRRVFLYYQLNYTNMFVEFMKERYSI